MKKYDWESVVHHLGEDVYIQRLGVFGGWFIITVYSGYNKGGCSSSFIFDPFHWWKLTKKESK